MSNKLEINHDVMKSLGKKVGKCEKLNKRPMSVNNKISNINVVGNAVNSQQSINDQLRNLDQMIDNVSDLLIDVNQGFSSYDIKLKDDIKK